MESPGSTRYEGLKKGFNASSSDPHLSRENMHPHDQPDAIFHFSLACMQSWLIRPVVSVSFTPQLLVHVLKS